MRVENSGSTMFFKKDKSRYSHTKLKQYLKSQTNISNHHHHHHQVLIFVQEQEHLTHQWAPLQVTRERSGSVVECLTRDRGAAGSSLIGVTALCP